MPAVSVTIPAERRSKCRTEKLHVRVRGPQAATPSPRKGNQSFLWCIDSPMHRDSVDRSRSRSVDPGTEKERSRVGDRETARCARSSSRASLRKGKNSSPLKSAWPRVTQSNEENSGRRVALGIARDDVADVGSLVRGNNDDDDNNNRRKLAHQVERPRASSQAASTKAGVLPPPEPPAPDFQALEGATQAAPK